jgi:hypothetical protein
MTTPAILSAFIGAIPDGPSAADTPAEQICVICGSPFRRRRSIKRGKYPLTV